MSAWPAVRDARFFIRECGWRAWVQMLSGALVCSVYGHAWEEDGEYEDTGYSVVQVSAYRQCLRCQRFEWLPTEMAQWRCSGCGSRSNVRRSEMDVPL